jgi:hypothetical protein
LQILPARLLKKALGRKDHDDEFSTASAADGMG